ncbi:hypothetical protein JTB14_012511 [Gonioctena quinquepunctata]|nr:hypothetical protein JTB14_012511 [Gonioctena quinquepunctata]
MLYCLDKWTRLLDSLSSVDIIYLDFFKAFDKVPQIDLLHEFEHFGIRGQLLKWIATFLSDNVFKVMVGSSHSELHQVILGVLKGSVLRPTLFLAYVPDLPSALHSDRAFSAVDSKFFGNPPSNHADLQSDLISVQRWCETWNIPLNIDKC